MTWNWPTCIADVLEQEKNQIGHGGRISLHRLRRRLRQLLLVEGSDPFSAGASRAIEQSMSWLSSETPKRRRRPPTRRQKAAQNPAGSSGMVPGATAFTIFVSPTSICPS